MPTLREWLDAHPDMTQVALGQMIGRTQGRISQIVKDGTTDLPTALAIEQATNGEVTIRDLLPQQRENAA